MITHSQKQKILFVITKSVWGGAQKYVYDLACNLPRERFEVAVAAGGNGILFERLQRAGIRTINIPDLGRDIRVGKEFRSFFVLSRLFSKEQPDVIHLNSSKVGGLGAIAGRIASFRTGKPMYIVFTAHGWGFQEDRLLFARAIIFFLSWVAALFQNMVITINERDYASAQRFVSHRKLALIPNGIAPLSYVSRQDARKFFAETIGKAMPPDSVLIGTIAELTKNKGLDYLVDAVDQIKHQIPTIKYEVFIIGKGEERASLEQQIRRLNLGDTVFLLASVSDGTASRYLKGFDVFVLPSRKEGLPYAIMEAMGAGLPVVASDVGGVPDLIVHDQNGLLVQPKNVLELTGAIATLLVNPAKRASLGLCASQTLMEKFSLRAMIEKTTRLYQSLL
ncbi:MAG: glycosyltransferase family 4 protein [Candidatus Sungbacteria bacterium]|nr:glycosyltransferase family 4 protein [Candidatus Sungbacteria bacterium]